MPRVGRNRPAARNPRVGPNRPAPRNPNIGPGRQLPGRAPPKPGRGGQIPKYINDPGIPAGPVPPYLTPEEIMAYAQARQAYEAQLNELDFNLSNAEAKTKYDQAEITKGALFSKRDSSDDFAARGLFRSSVRDADLFDIDATAEIRKRFLSDQLNTLRLNTENQKASLTNAWNTYAGPAGLEGLKVRNAMQAGADAPWIREPGRILNPAYRAPARRNRNQGNPTNFQRNTPISANPATGGTTAPPKPKMTGVGKAKKVKGKLA